jgi:hypothetical protein
MSGSRWYARGHRPMTMTDRARHLARCRVVTLAAVFALLTQVLLPHVHLRHELGGAVTPSVALASCAADCPAEVLTAKTGDRSEDPDRHAAGCPLCRAQNDARSWLLPFALVVSLPGPASSAPEADAAALAAAVVRSLASPRAPPRVS